TDGGRDVHIRYVAVALLLHHRIGDLRDRTEPHVADDAAFGDSNPGAPRLCGELAAHPFSAAADERVVLLRCRAAAGAELPAQLREVVGIVRRRRAYVDHWITLSRSGADPIETPKPRAGRPPAIRGRRQNRSIEPRRPRRGAAPDRVRRSRRCTMDRFDRGTAAQGGCERSPLVRAPAARRRRPRSPRSPFPAPGPPRETPWRHPEKRDRKSVV